MAIAKTVSFIPLPGLKLVSRLPSVFIRARRLIAVPLTVLKAPPTNGLPLLSRAMAKIASFIPKPGLKVLSRLPSLFMRAMRLIAMPLTVVNSPPTKGLPPLFRAIA